MAFLDVQNLQLSYRSAHTQAVLKNISFSLEHGESLALIGPSGVGKSSLLRVLAGLIKPDAGSISIDGEELTEPRAKPH